MRNRLLVVVSAVGLLFVATGCMAPQPPSQRVQEIARETNLAARFGRMDMALEHTADGTREHFMKRHADWGGRIRVFDMELTGFRMPDSEHATVLVDYQWMRIEENTLRQTRVEQTWRSGSKDSGWVITRERRLSGDVGLFGEVVARKEAPVAPQDAQFPTKTIRGESVE